MDDDFFASLRPSAPAPKPVPSPSAAPFSLPPQLPPKQDLWAPATSPQAAGSDDLWPRVEKELAALGLSPATVKEEDVRGLLREMGATTRQTLAAVGRWRSLVSATSSSSPQLAPPASPRTPPAQRLAATSVVVTASGAPPPVYSPPVGSGPLSPPSADAPRTRSWSLKRFSQRTGKHFNRLSSNADTGEVDGLVDEDDAAAAPSAEAYALGGPDTERAIVAWERGDAAEAVVRVNNALAASPEFLPALALWRALYRHDPSSVGPAEGRELTASRYMRAAERASVQAKNEAIEFLRRVSGPTPASQLLMGSLHTLVAAKRDAAEAVELYHAAAQRGLSAAQCNLGMHLANGQGTGKDVFEAVRLYKLSADAGNATARCCLGMCYEKGEGVPRNPEIAAQLYKLSADQGYAISQVYLGRCYADGNGVPRDARIAVQYYTLATEQGYAVGQECLGLCLLEGRGTDRDERRGAHLVKVAAEAGLASAQANLAKCYAEGRGVPRDDHEAVRLWKQAAAQGDPTATSHLRARGMSV